MQFIVGPKVPYPTLPYPTLPYPTLPYPTPFHLPLPLPYPYPILPLPNPTTHPILPYPTLPLSTYPYHTLPYPLPSPYPTPFHLPLPYPTLPYPTLPYPTLPYPTLPYPTLPTPCSCPYPPTLPYLHITKPVAVELCCHATALIVYLADHVSRVMRKHYVCFSYIVVQSLYFLNPKFQTCNFSLWLHSPLVYISYVVLKIYEPLC